MLVNYTEDVKIASLVMKNAFLCQCVAVSIQILAGKGTFCICLPVVNFRPEWYTFAPLARLNEKDGDNQVDRIGDG
jgi:hypothetical protein